MKLDSKYFKDTIPIKRRPTRFHDAGLIYCNEGIDIYFRMLCFKHYVL